MIRGHADGILLFEDKERLIEIKSIGLRSIELDYPKLYKPYREGQINLTELWARVKEPFPVHIRQATLYLHILRYRRRIDEILFIYEFKANQEVKVFNIGYRPETIAHILTGARDIVTAVDTQGVVRRPSWAESPDTKACRSCPYRATCWAGAL